MLELPPGSRTRIAARITKRGDGIREDDTTTIVNALKVRDRQIIREWLDIRIDVEPPPRLSIPSADNAFGNAGRFPSAMLSSPMGPPPVPVTEHQDQDHHQHLEPEFLELAFALQEIGADRCALLIDKAYGATCKKFQDGSKSKPKSGWSLATQDHLVRTYARRRTEPAEEDESRPATYPELDRLGSWYFAKKIRR